MLQSHHAVCQPQSDLALVLLTKFSGVSHLYRHCKAEHLSAIAQKLDISRTVVNAVHGVVTLCHLRAFCIAVQNHNLSMSWGQRFEHQCLAVAIWWIVISVFFCCTKKSINLLGPNHHPRRPRAVQTYPEQGKYCRVINQHLVRPTSVWNWWMDMTPNEVL